MSVRGKCDDLFCGTEVSNGEVQKSKAAQSPPLNLASH